LCAAGFSSVVPFWLPHWRNPAHGKLLSSTVAKPEHGVMSLSMPSYVSCSECTPRPKSFQWTRSLELEWLQPPDAGQPWKEWCVTVVSPSERSDYLRINIRDLLKAFTAGDPYVQVRAPAMSCQPPLCRQYGDWWILGCVNAGPG